MHFPQVAFSSFKALFLHIVNDLAIELTDSILLCVIVPWFVGKYNNTGSYLTLLHSELPKLNRVLAILSAIGLSNIGKTSLHVGKRSPSNCSNAKMITLCIHQHSSNSYKFHHNYIKGENCKTFKL